MVLPTQNRYRPPAAAGCGCQGFPQEGGSCTSERREARPKRTRKRRATRTTLDTRSTRRRQREPATPLHQRLTRCALLPLRCCCGRAARAGMRHECKSVPTRGKWWCGASWVGGWRKGMAAAGVAERSLGGQMVRNEPPAAAMPFRKPCGWLPPARAGLVLRPGATPARYGT